MKLSLARAQHCPRLGGEHVADACLGRYTSTSPTPELENSAGSTEWNTCACQCNRDSCWSSSTSCSVRSVWHSVCLGQERWPFVELGATLAYMVKQTCLPRFTVLRHGGGNELSAHAYCTWSVCKAMGCSSHLLPP